MARSRRGQPRRLRRLLRHAAGADRSGDRRELLFRGGRPAGRSLPCGGHGDRLRRRGRPRRDRPDRRRVSRARRSPRRSATASPRSRRRMSARSSSRSTRATASSSAAATGAASTPRAISAPSGFAATSSIRPIWSMSSARNSRCISTGCSAPAPPPVSPTRRASASATSISASTSTPIPAGSCRAAIPSRA